LLPKINGRGKGILIRKCSMSQQKFVGDVLAGRQTRLKHKQIRVLHSELLTELSSRFSSRGEFSRVETSLEGSDITEIFPKFKFRLVSTHSDPNFCKFFMKIGSERVFASWDEFGRLGHYQNISKFEKSLFPKLAKTKISEKNV